MCPVRFVERSERMGYTQLRWIGELQNEKVPGRCREGEKRNEAIDVPNGRLEECEARKTSSM